MERVLVETGVGGVTALHDYYQEYILKFEENMKRKVEEMMEKQRQLELNICSTKYLVPKNKTIDTFTSVNYLHYYFIINDYIML